MQTLGELVSIWRYPVKSLAPQALSETPVERDGLPGDRTQALIVERGHARAGKTYRGKENNALHLLADADAAARSARDRNVDVRLDATQAHYFDAAPVSIVFDAWLADASRLVGYELEPLRFRPNFFARSAPDFAGREADYTGAVLHIGGAVFEVRKPIERCATPTYDLATGEPDPAVLRAIAQHRGTYLGIYCDVVQPGTVRAGDRIERA